MKSAICFLLLLVATASAFEQCGKKGSGSRIIGGKDAGHGEFPWQVSLRIDPSYNPVGHFCGGTLLNKDWVLTAGHCLDGLKANLITVRTGEWYRLKEDGTEKDIPVAEYFIHEDYKWPLYVTFNNDIALIRLAESVDFSGPYAGPACLPEAGKDYRGHEKCILSGWGDVDKTDTSKVRADRLQKMTSTIWKDDDLVAAYPNSYLPDHGMGFGEPNRAGGRLLSCQGDSGGPLVCPNGNGGYDLAGLTSFGQKGCKVKPGVFTEVSQYRDWISKKTGGAV